MARFIVNLITWAIFLLSIGTLTEVTSQFMHLAAHEHQTGLVRLGGD